MFGLPFFFVGRGKGFVEEGRVGELARESRVCCTRRAAIVGNGVGGCFGGFRKVDDLDVDGGEKRSEEYEHELADRDKEGDETALDRGRGVEMEVSEGVVSSRGVRHDVQRENGGFYPLLPS